MNYVEEVKNGKAQLVDVRSKLEWKMGHAKGATHISLGSLSDGYTGDLDPDMPVYTYCASGGRSSQAESILKQQGFKSVTNIGGLSSWVQAGGETER